MKRILIIAILTVCAAAAWAAEPPASLGILNSHYSADPGVSKTIVTGKSLKRYNLEESRGLTLADKPEKAEAIEKAVAHDARNANDREISYRDGKIYYAFLTLKPKDDKNRYLFYLNQHLAGGNKIILIYMSGKADSESIKKMIKK